MWRCAKHSFGNTAEVHFNQVLRTLSNHTGTHLVTWQLLFFQNKYAVAMYDQRSSSCRPRRTRSYDNHIIMRHVALPPQKMFAIPSSHLLRSTRRRIILRDILYNKLTMAKENVPPSVFMILFRYIFYPYLRSICRVQSPAGSRHRCRKILTSACAAGPCLFSS